MYTFSLSFTSSFTFQTDKFTSSYIYNSNDKWKDILNDWMLSIQIPFRYISKEIGAKDTSHFKKHTISKQFEVIVKWHESK